MPTKIFISASPQSELEKSWAVGFSKSVAEAAGYREGDVYLYLKQRTGKAIPNEVRDNIQQARRMICLISDSYLQSGWCAYEHFLFFSKGKVFEDNCVGVLQPFVNRWVELPETLKRERIKFDLLMMRQNSSLTITRDLDKHLSGAWTEWLADVRHADDFRSLRTWPEILNDEEARSLVEIADPPDPTERMLERCAALCAYAIAADRYHDGGWGFSLGSSFDFDEYDGDELPRGRYDLNVVILTALAKSLTSEQITDAWNAIFAGLDGERQPRIQVRDRLPDLAGLLACLTSNKSLGADVRHDPLVKTTVQLERELAGQRWGLDENREGAEKFDYCATLLACLTELQPAIQTMTVALRQRFETPEMRKLLSRGRQDAHAIVSKCLADDNLFSAALARAATGGSKARGAGGTSGIRNDLHIAVIWLLLTLSKDCSDLLESELGKDVTFIDGGWKEDSFDKLIVQFRHAADADEPEPMTISLMLACAAVLSARGVDLPVRLQEIQDAVIRLLQRDDMARILLRLNVIGWISLILFAQRTMTRPIDHSLLQDMWTEGLRLREERNQVVSSQIAGEASEASAIRDAIDDRVKLRVRAAHEIWRPYRDEGDHEPTQAEFDKLLAEIRQASFWGPPIAKSRRPERDDADGAFMTGVLRVRASTKKIELETPGYNQMFVHPFSEITGMNITNLRGIRREFGDLDEVLVRLMGETVVVECYERVRDDFLQSGRSFEQRTQHITETLTGENWDTTQGFDDLLVVRKGIEGVRWIYRTALIQPRPGGFDDKFEDQVISWRFVEMPPTVQLMITPGPRIKELRNSDRRS